MVESLQMFLFLFKSKYRRKYSWFSPFLCSILIVLLFCQCVLTKCSGFNCLNGECRNDTCICFDGWQGSECQYCGGKVNLSSPVGIITDGPGNYSVSTRCTWLVTPPRVGPTTPVLRIRLESFATECGWDHLYVYDGDSVRAEKLLAVYSGVMMDGESGWTRQVIARSGSALLHFFSDDAYAMEGFNVTYAAYSCPSDDHRTNCSNHGECEDGTCRCEPYWTGVACDQPLCPEECNREYGAGKCTPVGCECVTSRTGASCERDRSLAGWGWAWREHGDGPQPPGLPPASAGHVLLSHGDHLLRIGGETYGHSQFLYRYKMSSGVWEPVETSGPTPGNRYAHAAVIYNNELIVYGGVVATDDPDRGGGLSGLEGRAGEVSNEVWRIRIDDAEGTEQSRWRNATPTTCSPHRLAPLKHCGGLHISGHTAVFAQIGPMKKPVMLVFFGHSPHYGYLHLVQEYYIDEGVWSAAATKGWPARAGFGHTAVWDELSKKVYVHGGLVSASEANQTPSSGLFEYEIDSRTWRPLPSALTPRYLHSAAFVSPGLMLVFGGNTHNDSAAAAVTSPAATTCYSSEALLYNVRCGTWYTISSPIGGSRAAHYAAVLPAQRMRTRAAIMHGGFDGRLRSDALVYETGAKCSLNTNEVACMQSAHRAAVVCVWRPNTGDCVALEEIGWKESFEDNVKVCVAEPFFDEHRCVSAESCGSCVSAGCAWCGACYASPQHCVRHNHLVALSIEECRSNAESLREQCSRYHSCVGCHSHQHHHTHIADESSQRACYWDYETMKCKPANTSEDIRSVSSGGPCSAPCSTFQTCSNCTAEECIWCASAGRCVDRNAYGASFPLGGCRGWLTNGGSAGAAAACGPAGAVVAAAGAAGGCGTHVSCASCRGEPACGWCDDGVGGGRGLCLPGGGKRPHAAALCTHHRWHFTRCPACQCNGHSICDSEARCIQPCAGRTIGEHCEKCAPGHWGNPLNGGQCQVCECNGQAVSCAQDTGRCFCTTKGLAGDHCDKCDNTNHYHTDPYNKGACYYDLAVDYQFTFNLSKKEDRHLTAINFRNAPVKPDVDADFSITCSAHARMNLTVRTRTDPTERTFFKDINCTNFKFKFAKSEHAFGVEDNVTLTTFFVYVYDFKPPLWIQISFSQYPKLNLQQFFITFSSCFLLLLLVAATLWKIKQRYDTYRRRQRLFVEMEQMASRPFSQVCVELEKGWGGSGVPAPVALEPCRGGRAAVLSLLVRLPTGGTGRAPPLGGLAVASALVTLGHHSNTGHVTHNNTTQTSKRPRHR